MHVGALKISRWDGLLRGRQLLARHWRQMTSKIGTKWGTGTMQILQCFGRIIAWWNTFCEGVSGQIDVISCDSINQWLVLQANAATSVLIFLCSWDGANMCSFMYSSGNPQYTSLIKQKQPFNFMPAEDNKFRIEDLEFTWPSKINSQPGWLQYRLYLSACMTREYWVFASSASRVSIGDEPALP